MAELKQNTPKMRWKTYKKNVSGKLTDVKRYEYISFATILQSCFVFFFTLLAHLH